MFFNNATIYQLTKPLEITAEALDKALSENEFKPCGPQDQVTYGFTRPLGDRAKLFTHVVGDFIMICTKSQEKVIPSASLKDAIDKKVDEIWQQEGRAVGRKERGNIREEILFSMLPRAFTKSTLLYAYIDTRENLIVVNTSSSKRAEDLLGRLRDAIGSLPVIPLQSKLPATHVMTEWLKTAPPANFTLGGEVELQALEDNSVVRTKYCDLTSDEILAHVANGMMASRIAIDYAESASFVVDDKLQIKRLKFEDVVIQRAADSSPETREEEFDSNFSVMTLELRQLINDLVSAFGGTNEAAA